MRKIHAPFVWKARRGATRGPRTHPPKKWHKGVPFRLGSSPVLDGSHRRPFPDESQAIPLSIGSSSLLRLGWVRNRVYLRNGV